MPTLQLIPRLRRRLDVNRWVPIGEGARGDRSPASPDAHPAMSGMPIYSDPNPPQNNYAHGTVSPPPSYALGRDVRSGEFAPRSSLGPPSIVSGSEPMVSPMSSVHSHGLTSCNLTSFEDIRYDEVFNELDTESRLSPVPQEADEFDDKQSDEPSPDPDFEEKVPELQQPAPVRPNVIYLDHPPRRRPIKTGQRPREPQIPEVAEPAYPVSAVQPSRPERFAGPPVFRPQEPARAVEPTYLMPSVGPYYLEQVDETPELEMHQPVQPVQPVSPPSLLSSRSSRRGSEPHHPLYLEPPLPRLLDQTREVGPTPELPYIPPSSPLSLESSPIFQTSKGIRRVTASPPPPASPTPERVEAQPAFKPYRPGSLIHKSRQAVPAESIEPQDDFSQWRPRSLALEDTNQIDALNEPRPESSISQYTVSSPGRNSRNIRRISRRPVPTRSPPASRPPNVFLMLGSLPGAEQLEPIPPGSRLAPPIRRSQTAPSHHSSVSGHTPINIDITTTSGHLNDEETARQETNAPPETSEYPFTPTANWLQNLSRMRWTAPSGGYYAPADEPKPPKPRPAGAQIPTRLRYPVWIPIRAGPVRGRGNKRGIRRLFRLTLSILSDSPPPVPPKDPGYVPQPPRLGDRTVYAMRAPSARSTPGLRASSRPGVSQVGSIGNLRISYQPYHSWPCRMYARRGARSRKQTLGRSRPSTRSRSRGQGRNSRIATGRATGSSAGNVEGLRRSTASVPGVGRTHSGGADATHRPMEEPCIPVVCPRRASAETV